MQLTQAHVHPGYLSLCEAFPHRDNEVFHCDSNKGVYTGRHRAEKWNRKLLVTEQNTDVNAIK